MQHKQYVRDFLIHNTIHLIAEGGFEKATTNAITHYGESNINVNMNEVYIYRLFGNKESLYNKAFELLDRELLTAMNSTVNSVEDIHQNTVQKLWKMFCSAWQFMLRNEAHCKAYLRYYYSSYFKGESLSKHNKLFEQTVEAFSPLFKQEADVRAIMHSVLTTLLDFAIRVFNGDLQNDDVNRPHIFLVLYTTMAIYFKEELQTHTIKEILQVTQDS